MKPLRGGVPRWAATAALARGRPRESWSDRVVEHVRKRGPDRRPYPGGRSRSRAVERLPVRRKIAEKDGAQQAAASTAGSPNPSASEGRTTAAAAGVQAGEGLVGDEAGQDHMRSPIAELRDPRPDRGGGREVRIAVEIAGEHGAGAVAAGAAPRTRRRASRCSCAG